MVGRVERGKWGGLVVRVGYVCLGGKLVCVECVCVFKNQVCVSCCVCSYRGCGGDSNCEPGVREWD